MKEISNSTLALLVVVAIIVSVSGTLVSLSKLSLLGGFMGLTGMVSSSVNATGLVNLSVETTTYINATDNEIQLGVLEPGGTGTSEGVEDWFHLRNDGSVNITIRFWSHPDIDIGGRGAINQSGEDGASFLAGRGPFISTTTTEGCLNRTPVDSLQACFMIRCKNSTYTDAICNTTYAALPLSAGGAVSRKVIEYLAPGPDGINDSAVFGVNVTVPVGEGAGEKWQYVNIYAYQSAS